MKKNHLWYASYGSNMSLERFLCYIRGGKPMGAARAYEGCQDKTLPLADACVTIPHQMYFARSSSTWHGGGVCFIRVEQAEEAQTLGRMYLISQAQFIDVLKQESHFSGNLEVDFGQLEVEGECLLKPDLWYGNLLYLGEERGCPIITFTNAQNLEEEINSPHPSYLEQLKKGIRETYELSEQEIESYLKARI